jgi:hypothetical protein
MLLDDDTVRTWHRLYEDGGIVDFSGELAEEIRLKPHVFVPAMPITCLTRTVIARLFCGQNVNVNRTAGMKPQRSASRDNPET